MISWKTVDLEELVPQNVVGAVEKAAGVVETFSKITEQFAEILGILGPLVSAAPDPVSEALEVIIDTLRNIVDDFRNTNVFALINHPLRIEDVGGLQQFENDLVNSFFDVNDLNRPIFSNTAKVSGAILTVAAPNVFQLKKSFEDIAKIFSLESLGSLTEEIAQNFKFRGNDKALKIGKKTVLFLGQDVVPKAEEQEVLFVTELSNEKIPSSATVRIGDEEVELSEIKKPGEGNKLVGVFRKAHKIKQQVIILDSSGLDVSGNDRDSQIRLAEDISPIGGEQPIKLTSLDLGERVHKKVSKEKEVISGHTVNVDRILTITEKVEFPQSGFVQIGRDQVRYSDLDRQTNTIRGTITRRWRKGTPVFFLETTLGQLAFPDWHRTDISQIFPDFKLIFDGLSFLADGLETAKDLSDSIVRTAELIVNKAKILLDKITELANVVSRILSVFKSPGFAVLLIPEANGVEGFINEVLDAGNKPDFPPDFYVAGIVLFAGTTGLAFELLDEIF